MTTPVIKPALPVPGYHAELRAHLEVAEPELWAWFTETLHPDTQDASEAELELLKNAYRLEGEAFAELVGAAAHLAEQMGLSNTITLYQELHDTGRNARVQIFGDHVHVVFSGDLLTLLDTNEQHAVLAHELAHVYLLFQENEAYRVLDSMIHQMADHSMASDAVEETARRLRLHTEVYADALAASITGDRDSMISSVVKVQTGLSKVDPVAYLRQAEEILKSDDASAIAWTHPELHIRVACLAANTAAGARGADPTVLRLLIEGRDDLDHLDLLGQLRLQELTHRILRTVRDGDKANPAIDNYCGQFVHLMTHNAMTNNTLDDGELADTSPSVRFLAAALLVDVALLDDSDGSGGSSTGDEDEVVSLRRLSTTANRLGVEVEFDRILSRATDRTLGEVRKLRRKSA